MQDLNRRRKADLQELEASHSTDFETLHRARREMEARYDDLAVRELTRPGLNDIMDHIEHIIGVAGIDHVGLGIDLNFAAIPKDMDDCTKLPLITEELVRRGYSDEEIKRVLGENVLRLMEEVIGS
jgi:membrane dipeptidase